MPGYFGRSPIHPAVLAVGKGTMGAAAVLWALGLAGIDVVGRRVPPMRPVAVVAGALGLLLVAVALGHRGRHARR